MLRRLSAAGVGFADAWPCGAKPASALRSDPPKGRLHCGLPLSLLLKPACAMRCAGRIRSRRRQPAKRSGDVALSPACRLSLAVMGPHRRNGLVTRRFASRPMALAHATTTGGCCSQERLCAYKVTLGFSHSAKNDPPVAKALPTGGCCVATLFFE